MEKERFLRFRMGNWVLGRLGNFLFGTLWISCENNGNNLSHLSLWSRITLFFKQIPNLLGTISFQTYSKLFPRLFIGDKLALNSETSIGNLLATVIIDFLPPNSVLFLLNVFNKFEPSPFKRKSSNFSIEVLFDPFSQSIKDRR